MTSVWAMPALELLQHAFVHSKGGSVADQRIAFVSIDNALETILGTYLEVFAPEDDAKVAELPSKYPRPFPARLALVEKLEPKLFNSGELLQIEYYHRIRNRIYHQGIGGGVEEGATENYFALAKRAFERLLASEFVAQGNRWENLTPEARRELETKIKLHKAAQHGEKTRAGAEKARRQGRVGKRGSPTTGVRPDEIELLLSLRRSGESYNAIAAELTQRRRRAGEKEFPVAFQKVRRKLIELGEVPTTSDR